MPRKKAKKRCGCSLGYTDVTFLVLDEKGRAKGKKFRHMRPKKGAASRIREFDLLGGKKLRVQIVKKGARPGQKPPKRK